jgi:hypothetical protein
MLCILNATRGRLWQDEGGGGGRFGWTSRRWVRRFVCSANSIYKIRWLKVWKQRKFHVMTWIVWVQLNDANHGRAATRKYWITFDYLMYDILWNYCSVWDFSRLLNCVSFFVGWEESNAVMYLAETALRSKVMCVMKMHTSSFRLHSMRLHSLVATYNCMIYLHSLVWFRKRYTGSVI